MAEDKVVKGQLKAVPLFEGLSDKELQTVANRSRVVEHKADHEIVLEGRGSVGFHLILEGQAEVTQGSQVIGALGPGDYFGEISLIDGQPRSATVKTSTPVTSLFLASWDFGILLEENSKFMHKILLGLCQTIRAKEASSQ